MHICTRLCTNMCIYLDVWMYGCMHVHVPCGVYQMWDRYTTQLVDELRMTMAWKQRKVREGVLLMCMCVYIYARMKVIVKTLCIRGSMSVCLDTSFVIR